MSKHDKSAPDEIGQRRVAWQELVILCRSCSRACDGGFGKAGKDDLRSALRRELRKAGHGRSVRVIETGCLGICPKRAVVTFRGGDPGRLLTVPRGQPVAGVLDALGLTTPE